MNPFPGASGSHSRSKSVSTGDSRLIMSDSLPGESRCSRKVNLTYYVENETESATYY